MILFRAFGILVLLAGMSCTKEGASDVENVVTVDLPEKIEFSPSGKTLVRDKLTSQSVESSALRIPIVNNSVFLPLVTLTPKVLAKEQVTSLDLSKKNLPVEQKPLFRDPFSSYLASASEEEMHQERESALLDFDAETYKYVGFLMQGGIALALIEDPSGVGYTLKVGSQIGKNSGRVESVQSNQIVIKEGQSTYITLKLVH